MQARLSFEIESGTGVIYATLIDKEHPLTGTAGGGEGGSFSTGPFASDLYYVAFLPEGPLTVDIVGISSLCTVMEKQNGHRSPKRRKQRSSR